MSEITIVDIEPQTVLGVRKHGRYEEIVMMVVGLFLYAMGRGIQIEGRPIFVCHEMTLEEVMKAYEETGVPLSLSGHYHAGQDATVRNGVTYLTCASLAESPFSYYIVRMVGRKVSVERHTLGLPVEGIIDGHIHTHFGYCARDVHPEQSAERAQRLGAAGIACVEHAGQVYLSENDFWSIRHIADPDAIPRSAVAGTNRMRAFKAEMARFHSSFIRIGLETEVDASGNLTLLDEDRDGWDVLLGAVHWLPPNMPCNTPAECEASFLRLVERMAAQDVDVLAHPFRFFLRNGLARPTGIYRDVARLLAANDVAAEVNVHANDPDPVFFRRCLEEGVRITLGSDAHYLTAVADLGPHLRFLESIGAPMPRTP